MSLCVIASMCAGACVFKCGGLRLTLGILVALHFLAGAHCFSYPSKTACFLEFPVSISHVLGLQAGHDTHQAFTWDPNPSPHTCMACTSPT